MKCGVRVALGVAGGYFLGRTKKMKLALMLGGMAAGRQAGGPGELLKIGTKLLSSSPELSRLTDEVRGRLLEAGKGAVLAVAARQVESLTDRVGKRVESFGDVGVPRRRKKAEEEPEAEEYAEDEYAEDEGARVADDSRGGRGNRRCGGAAASCPASPPVGKGRARSRGQGCRRDGDPQADGRPRRRCGRQGRARSQERPACSDPAGRQRWLRRRRSRASRTAFPRTR